MNVTDVFVGMKVEQALPVDSPISLDAVYEVAAPVPGVDQDVPLQDSIEQHDVTAVLLPASIPPFTSSTTLGDTVSIPTFDPENEIEIEFDYKNRIGRMAGSWPWSVFVFSMLEKRRESIPV